MNKIIIKIKIKSSQILHDSIKLKLDFHFVFASSLFNPPTNDVSPLSTTEDVRDISAHKHDFL